MSARRVHVGLRALTRRATLGFVSMGFVARGVSRGMTLAFALTLGSVAFGADDDKVFVPGASRLDTPAKTAGASLSSMSLILGVAMAGAGGWLVWRNRRGTPIGRDQRALAVEETRSLGNRQYLVVASYEGKKFLLGVCPGRIDMLSPLDGSALKETSRE